MSVPELPVSELRLKVEEGVTGSRFRVSGFPVPCLAFTVSGSGNRKTGNLESGSPEPIKFLVWEPGVPVSGS